MLLSVVVVVVGGIVGGIVVVGLVTIRHVVRINLRAQVELLDELSVEKRGRKILRRLRGLAGGL